MDHIDNLQQFERRQHCAPIENISSVALQSLDTVRALHQTVVSLRTALEDAHREIETLKKQIVITNDIGEGKKLREKIVKNVPIRSATNLDTDQSSNQNKNEDSENDEDNDDEEPKVVESEEEYERHSKTRTQITSTATKIFIDDQRVRNTEKTKIILPAITTEQQHYSARTPRMASTIDVKIKLSSNIKLDSCNDSSSNCSDGTTTAESTSDANTPREATSSVIDQDAPTKDAQMAESMKNINQNEAGITEETTILIENANENETRDEANDDDDDDNDDLAASDYPKSPQRSVGDNQEEVDDIELIFSSDDKEYPQEDLVSISYYEPWQTCGQSGTPVLLNFGQIGSDDTDQPNADSNSAENLSPSPIDPDRFYNAIKENVGNMAQQYSRESSDSLTFYGDNNNFRYNKSSSIEQDADSGKVDVNADEMRRDESFDTFESTGFSSALGRRWTNYNVFVETDISKVGIAEENVLERGGRRNTCPNPPAYRPIIHREALLRHQNVNNTVAAKAAQIRCPTFVKFARNARLNGGRSPRALIVDAAAANKCDNNNSGGPKRSSSAQTDISALPEHWRSESHLAGGLLGTGFFTLPSKFVPPSNAAQYKRPLKVSEKTREARRVLLSDINFTSMVPELSRSADHLCQAEHQQTNEGGESAGMENANSTYYKGPMLKTPDYVQRGLTPSMSLTSPGVSQWTVNENSYGTQTTQTDNYWGIRHGDSFDSCKSYSTGSKISTSFGRHHRSRSCPSVRCIICKHHHHHGSGGIKMSESMHYTPRVTFQEPIQKVRGSLPDLRPDCTCGCSRYVSSAGRAATAGRTLTSRYGDSCGSTESLIDEADDYLRKSVDGAPIYDNEATSGSRATAATRRCSENDLKKDFSPSRQTLPFLPKSSKCLKVGHLAKVIAKNGRVVIGRVRYIGPLISTQSLTVGCSGGTATITDSDSETYVGLQLPNKIGECDGSFEGRRIFDCEPQHGIFVPFKKIVMAWTS